MDDDRIAKLSQRFSKRDQAEKKAAQLSGEDSKTKGTTQRKRRSFYIDQSLISRLDQAYPKFNHDLYPRVVDKALFLEALIEYGLDHLEDIKAIVEQKDNS